ncbi:hypothetical protein GY231_004633 [Salmonella enterica]|nr:hypothetical protein [Salmonella enterica]
MLFPNRRGRESAARAGILLWNLSTGQVMNRLFIYKRERLCIQKKYRSGV